MKKLFITFPALFFLLSFFITVDPASHPAPAAGDSPDDSLAYGLLIPATSTMTRAWEIPRDPTVDPRTAHAAGPDSVREGFMIFTHTPEEAPLYARNGLSCSSCHLNAGQRERALPLVGIASVFPEFNKRAARTFLLEDRIIECFRRSMDASEGDLQEPRFSAGDTLSASTREVASVAAYLRWISRGFAHGDPLPWRGQNALSAQGTVALSKLDTARGRALFLEHCANCHGEDGQGVAIGDKKAGPLWGRMSWNDGAGAARILTLAGIIRFAMPYLNPGSLTDEEAEQIAAYINAQPRPSYPFKAADYPGSAPPSDAVYYRHRSE